LPKGDFKTAALGQLVPFLAAELPNYLQKKAKIKKKYELCAYISMRRSRGLLPKTEYKSIWNLQRNKLQAS
jgi:hypothetical protein